MHCLRCVIPIKTDHALKIRNIMKFANPKGDGPSRRLQNSDAQMIWCVNLSGWRMRFIRKPFCTCAQYQACAIYGIARRGRRGFHS